MILLVILLDSLFGGTNTPLVKYSVAKLSPNSVAFARFFLASVFILPLVLKERIFSKISFEKNLLIANILFAANILIFVNAISHTSIIMAQLFYLLNAPFVAVIGYFFLKEKLLVKQITGLVLSLLGLTVLIEGSVKTKDVLTFGTPLGNFFVFCGVIVWTLYIVFSRKISKLYTPLKLTFHNFLATTIFALIFLPFDFKKYHINLRSFNTEVNLALVALALFSTVLFFFFYQWIIKNTSAFIASLVNYLATLLAASAGIIFFGERLSTNYIVGAGLLLTGVFLASNSYKNQNLQKLRSWIFQ